ncbi:MAG: hypothetical protein ACW981_19665 [Candidatus Hodarchaeales archaeon]|jgi:hypothetical protein
MIDKKSDLKRELQKIDDKLEREKIRSLGEENVNSWSLDREMDIQSKRRHIRMMTGGCWVIAPIVLVLLMSILFFY